MGKRGPWLSSAQHFPVPELILMQACFSAVSLGLPGPRQAPKAEHSPHGHPCPASAYSHAAAVTLCINPGLPGKGWRQHPLKHVHVPCTTAWVQPAHRVGGLQQGVGHGRLVSHALPLLCLPRARP